MSVTKTCLDVLQDLGKAFSDAIRPEGLHKPDIIAPYIVENDTGFDITLNLKQGALYLHSTHLPNSADSDGAARSGVVFQSTASDVEPKQVTDCRISPGGKAYLQAKQASALSSISAFSSLNSSQLQEMFLHVQVRNIDWTRIRVYVWVNTFFSLIRLEILTKKSFCRYTKLIVDISHCTGTQSKNHGALFRT